MGMGSVFAQGILGAIGGAGAAVAKTAFDEMKEESERRREERLSQLRMKEYRARADIDIENAPRKAEAEAKGKAKGEEITRPGIIETRRQTSRVDTEAQAERERERVEIEIEAAPRRRAEKVADEKEVGAVRHSRNMSEIAAREESSIRVQRASAAEARRNNWRVDEDGFYIDGNGDRVTRTVKIEGRPETVFIKAPKSKTEARDAKWLEREELDALNRRIQEAEKLGDDDRVEKLQAEKRELLARLSGNPSSVKDPNDPLGLRAK